MVVGGSYPGALSAWFRYKYPHLADISWASSGVVHAITNFTEYDHSIYNSTEKGGCTETFQKLTNWLDAQQNNKKQADQIEWIIGGVGQSYATNMEVLADNLSGLIQYGGRVKACAVADKIKGKPFIDQLKIVMGEEDSLPELHKDKMEAKRFGLTLGQGFPGNGMSWTYQFCSTFGWF